MKDPKPENIEGRKVETHTFQHSIRWDYALGGVALLYIGWKLFGDDGTSDGRIENASDSTGFVNVPVARDEMEYTGRYTSEETQ